MSYKAQKILPSTEWELNKGCYSYLGWELLLQPVPGPVWRDGLEPVSIHLCERDGQVPNTGYPGQGDKRRGDGWRVQATAPFRLLGGPWGGC